MIIMRDLTLQYQPVTDMHISLLPHFNQYQPVTDMRISLLLHLVQYWSCTRLTLTPPPLLDRTVHWYASRQLLAPPLA